MIYVRFTLRCRHCGPYYTNPCDFIGDRQWAAYMWKKICVFMSTITYSRMYVADWESLMIEASERPSGYLQVGPGGSTQIDAEDIPVWTVLLSGATAWIQNSYTSVVGDSLRSGRVTKCQWLRWAAQLLQASAVAKDWGFSHLRRETEDIAAYIQCAVPR